MSIILIAIFILSIGASFVQRTTGFGFGIFIITMLPYFMPTYGEATTLSGILALTTSAAIVWRLRRYVTWQRLWPILLTFIVVSTMAIFVLTRIEDHILKQILGVALIVISIYRKMLEFIESAPFQICIMGHSCGNSDRTLLNTLFEHHFCTSIMPYYYINEKGKDNYLELVMNISRNFTDMKLMRDRVVNKKYCEPLVDVTNK